MRDNIMIDGFIITIEVEPMKEKGVCVFVPYDVHGRPKFQEACITDTEKNGVFRTSGYYHRVFSHNGHPDLLPPLPNM